MVTPKSVTPISSMKNGRPRTFCYMQERTYADPAYEFPLIEYDPSNRYKASVNYKTWSGWRARLITWLIDLLLPEPKTLYTRYLHDMDRMNIAAEMSKL
jgi:hypothetical protein